LLSPEGLFLAQNAPKIVCRPGSARTRWGSLQRSDRLAEFKGPTSKEGDGSEEGSGGKKGEGRGGEALRTCPLHIISGYATVTSLKILGVTKAIKYSNI